MGIALMMGVATGYYIWEPLIRQHEMKRREAEAELRAVAAAADEPFERVQQAAAAKNAPITRWLLYRNAK